MSFGARQETFSQDSFTMPISKFICNICSPYPSALHSFDFLFAQSENRVLSEYLGFFFSVHDTGTSFFFWHFANLAVRAIVT
jgi:hypothetical protein